MIRFYLEIAVYGFGLGLALRGMWREKGAVLLLCRIIRKFLS